MTCSLAAASRYVRSQLCQRWCCDGGLCSLDQGGGAIKRLLESHKAQLHAALARLKAKKGAKTVRDLLPKSIRDLEAVRHAVCASDVLQQR